LPLIVGLAMIANLLSAAPGRRALALWQRNTVPSGTPKPTTPSSYQAWARARGYASTVTWNGLHQTATTHDAGNERIERLHFA